MNRLLARSWRVALSVGAFACIPAAALAQRPFPPGHPPTPIDPVSLGEVDKSMSPAARVTAVPGHAHGSAADDLPRRDPAALGQFVRARSAQLQFCYHEALVRHPNLAGAVTMAITITGSGQVTGIAETQRSWSGAGTDEIESCLRRKIRAWKFPAADESRGTYSFSLSFTR
ncbi:MAG TPA: AgmX/PglI C-terminal domain-containing protein [Gemmatimonadaceae bacterium]|nr:AgmX/PglI C-terminal domain-containing protein [Gemmatimonadaceae bacterium]